MYLIDIDGNNLQQLTYDLDIVDFDWSPDGKQIALFTIKAKTIKMYIMDVYEGSMQLVLEFDIQKAYRQQSEWSPDGQYIAFTSDMNGEGGIYGDDEIYIYELGSGELRQITDTDSDEGSNNYFSWSPDSTRIAFNASRIDNGGIYIINVENGNEQRLTADMSIEYSPVWSPDGKMLAFNVVVPGTYLIYVIDSDGSNLRLIADSKYWAAPSDNISWSPDSKKIVFSEKQKDLSALQVADVKSGKLFQLTNKEGLVYYPKWSPDGEWIVFLGTISEFGHQVCVIRIDGSDPQCITEKLYSPHQFSWRP